VSIDTRVYEYIINEEEYPDQAVIVKEGGFGDWVYLIIEGKVKVKKETPKGLATIATLGEGEIFGEMALLSESKRTASVVAEGQVLLGVVDSARLIEDLNHLSPQLRKLVYTLSRRLEDATRRAVSKLVE
jgi:CRP-like cAMP-binding protein